MPPRITRRRFLVQTAAGSVLASHLPALGPLYAAPGGTPANEKIAIGCIGTGDRGRQVMRHFLNQPDCRIVAVCDVKSDAAKQAKDLVDRQYQNQDCASCADFRELLANPKIDAVLIASTDNWHVLHALAAVNAGKDLYVEKPLAVSFGEGRLLRDAVAKNKRVFQFGTQQRSDRKFRLACELARNGHIGKLKHINVWAPGSKAGGSSREVPPPPTLNYDFWLGPARYRPHTEHLTDNDTWWYVSDFATGFIAGWGIHPMDIALWGAGNLAESPVNVEGKGAFPSAGVCDTALDWDVDFKFANGLTMKFVGVGDGGFAHEKEWQDRYGRLESHGTVFEGSAGWIHVDRTRINLHPENLIDLDPETFKIQLVHSPDHVKNFLSCVRTRGTPVSPIESAVLADAFCHVPNIALRLGRPLRYDPARECFEADAEANRRLAVRAMRAPWKA
jgi:predicted dehydrogenase